MGNRTRAAGPTIGAGYARGLLNFAVSKGASREQLLERSQIGASEVEDLDNRIPLARYEALMRAGAELTGEPALALEFGEAVRMQEVSIVGLICEACETTLDVGVQLNRYSRLVYDDGGENPLPVIRVERDEEGMWMVATSPLFTNHPHVAESEFARLVWNTRAMFGAHPYMQENPFPLAVAFMHAEPSYRAAYDRIFGAPIAFGAKWNALRISEGFLSLRQPPVSRYVFGVLSARAQELLKALESSNTARGQVESLLIPVLHAGEPSIARIAEKLNTSRQTLYRRLKAEGVTYEKLLDDLRHRMALHYLNGKKVSVNEAAYLVGFSDPSAFSRAFKRWTGASPRALRNSSAT